MNKANPFYPTPILKYITKIKCLLSHSIRQGGVEKGSRDRLTYIVITCIILYSAIFNFYDPVNYLLYEVSVMRYCDNSALVFTYCLLWEELNTIRTIRDKKLFIRRKQTTKRVIPQAFL